MSIEVFPGSSAKAQLSWGPGPELTDLDCAAIAFDLKKVMIDVCFYNKLEACSGVLKHSGDNRDGLKEGVDEEIILDLRSEKLQTIWGFIFVVNSRKGSKMENVTSGTIAFKGSAGQTLGEAPLPSFDAFGTVSAILYRDISSSDKWLLQFVNTPTKGRTFQDSMPQLQKALTTVLGDGVTRLAGTFDLAKADTLVITTPPTPGIRDPSTDEDIAVLTNDGDDLMVGLGWTCATSFDLDSAIVVTDGVDGGRALNVVNFQDSSFGRAVRYQGDNTTGKGEGDDERILLDLDCLPHQVKCLFVVVNVYTGGGSFASVTEAFVRLVQVKSGKELCRFTLSGAQLKQRGLIYAKIYRGPGGGWLIREMFKECAAERTARDQATLDGCGVVGWAADSEIAAIEASASQKQPPFSWY